MDHIPSFSKKKRPGPLSYVKALWNSILSHYEGDQNLSVNWAIGVSSMVIAKCIDQYKDVVADLKLSR